MKRETVMYGENVNFEGKNGFFKQSGLEISCGMGNYLNLFPFTSKGEIGKCMMQIPRHKIQDVIDALEKMK